MKKIVAQGNGYRVLEEYNPFMSMYEYKLQRYAKFLWWHYWGNVPFGHGYGWDKLDDWRRHYDMQEIEK